MDPEAFIEATEKQMKITGKNNRAKAIFDVEIVVALMCMSKHEDALDILNEIDTRYIQKWDGSLLYYYSAEMNLYYNIGQEDKAKEIYESKIRDYPIKILNESRIMDSILSNKSFNEKEYSTCKELLNKVLQNNKSRRVKIEVYYMLANIAQQEGNLEEAIKKYKIVAEKGNKLYSSYLAKEKLKELSIREEEKIN